MGIKDISARRLKASKELKKEDQIYGQKVAEMAKRHSSEASCMPNNRTNLCCLRAKKNAVGYIQFKPI